MGGCLADFHEATQMMTMDQLRAYPKTIVTMMHKWNLSPNDTVIYLSTDSSYAEKFIRRNRDRIMRLQFLRHSNDLILEILVMMSR